MSSTYKGKLQILFNYLPGKVFDTRDLTIARIIGVRGHTYQDLNAGLVVRKINEHAQAWDEAYRPAFSNRILIDSSRFVLLDPKQVFSEIFPKVFWCSNKSCNKVFDYSNSNSLPSTKTCSRCKQGKLSQLRFIRIHRCGHIEPLTPPKCEYCKASDMALDTRESVRIADFKWRCLNCQHVQSLFIGKCFKCTWPIHDPKMERVDIEVFRSGKVYYVHTATLINIPQVEYDSLFRNEDWHVVSAAKYFELPHLNGVKTYEFSNNIQLQLHGRQMISSEDLDSLFERYNNHEITQEQFIAETARLKSKKNPTIEELKNDIIRITGLSEVHWKNSKYDILDTIVPFEISSFKDIEERTESHRKSLSMGIQRLSLLSDFPIIIASYGFSRSDHLPNFCYLNPFPVDKEHKGRIPIYVDKISADALCFTLDYQKVIRWLRKNGFSPTLSSVANDAMASKAYFITLFENIDTTKKLFWEENPEAKMVMGLLHTYSHLAIRHAALLCGLDKTSLSEYVIPKTLTFVIYCNHRFGATLGALTSLFEQSLLEWLVQLETERDCVYDPVCYDQGGNCHSCTHLAETSCRFFNLNLGRIFLFGGRDQQLEREIKGFMDFTD